MGHTLQVIAAERAGDEPARCERIDRLYLLPFDLPAGEDDPRAFVRRHFPRVELLNSIETHDLCWDKLRADQRLLTRGVPVPGTLFTESADEVRAFVAEHQFAILKERFSCGGQGHVVLCDTDDVLVGEAGQRRFVVELSDDPETPRRLAAGVLTYPPPFFVQRLVGDDGPKGVFTPGRLLRAYVLGGRVAFWTERYRDHYRRPADWIVNVGLGAKYRFVLETSEELRKLALRAADALGIRAGVIDLIRASTGAYVVEADTDGRHMYIDRSFKMIPDFRAAFDLDHMIAAALANEDIPALAAPE
jgi:glutathione synthase/RimK-type ligase-like ATP-grasp enzyme